MINQLSGILLPVFVLAAIGFGWRKLGIPFEREFVTRLVLNVAGPCLVVDTLANMTIAPREFIGMLGGAMALFFVTVAVVWGVLRACGLSVRDYLPAVAVGNTGNLGLPLCLLAFGQEGLGFAVAVYVSNSICQFTLTPMLQSKDSPIRTLFTTPIVYGAIIGLAILFFNVEIPVWADSTIGLLGALLIPLMLIALGNTLGELKITRVKFSVSMGVLRLAVGFAVGYFIAWAFGLEGAARGVIILQGAMPSAVFNYLFAARYNRVPEDVAGIVLSSTIISLLTLPLLVAYVLSFDS